MRRKGHSKQNRRTGVGSGRGQRARLFSVSAWGGCKGDGLTLPRFEFKALRDEREEMLPVVEIDKAGKGAQVFKEFATSA